MDKLFIFSWMIFFHNLMIFILFSDRNEVNENTAMISALIVTVLALGLILIIWYMLDNNWKYFQFVEKQYRIARSNFYLELVSSSVYFVLLTTFCFLVLFIYETIFIFIKSSFVMTPVLFYVGSLFLTYIMLPLFASLISKFDRRSALLLGLAAAFTLIIYIYMVQGLHQANITISLIIFCTCFLDNDDNRYHRDRFKPPPFYNFIKR